MRKIINANLDLLNHLSPWLRLELTDHLHRTVITKHMFFAGLPRNVPRDGT